MTDHITTLVLSDTETEKNTVAVKVLQNLPLSSILFLFYTAELLNTCNNSNKRLSTSAFMNDTILLAYDVFTETNCHTLT